MQTLACVLPFAPRWLESCDLRIGEAEADYLNQLPGGGSLHLTVTLMDKDLLGGDEAISSLEAVVTPESLGKRESSVLWHRLFSQVRPYLVVSTRMSSTCSEKRVQSNLYAGKQLPCFCTSQFHISPSILPVHQQHMGYPIHIFTRISSMPLSPTWSRVSPGMHQGRDRGFLRLGCCWIPADLEPVNVCGLRPEERVETGTLYAWLKTGRELSNRT